MMRLIPFAALVAGILIIPTAGAPQANGSGPAAALARPVAQTPPVAGQRSGPPGQQAQGPPRPAPNAEQFLGGGGEEWWKDETIKAALKLTESQVRTISQIFDRRVRDATPIYDEYRKRRMELDQLVQERTISEAAFGVQVIQVEALRSQLNETRTVMLYTIYRRLDPAQYQKLREIQDQRFRRGGGPPRPGTW